MAPIQQSIKPLLANRVRKCAERAFAAPVVPCRHGCARGFCADAVHAQFCTRQLPHSLCLRYSNKPKLLLLPSAAPHPRVGRRSRDVLGPRGLTPPKHRRVDLGAIPRGSHELRHSSAACHPTSQTVSHSEHRPTRWGFPCLRSKRRGTVNCCAPQYAVTRNVHTSNQQRGAVLGSNACTRHRRSRREWRKPQTWLCTFSRRDTRFQHTQHPKHHAPIDTHLPVSRQNRYTAPIAATVWCATRSHHTLRASKNSMGVKMPALPASCSVRAPVARFLCIWWEPLGARRTASSRRTR